MEEIVKHINDTNASYRAIGAGDAKNTDLFLDNEHYELFKDAGEQVTVRFNRENLTKAILFIASILPRKYDNSATHKTIYFSTAFVFDQIAFLDGFFTLDGAKVDSRTQIWNARKDVPKANGEIDKRFYFNGLFEEIEYTNYKGERKSAKFTIRNYLAGGYSDLHIKKANNGIFDVWITNTLEPYNDGKERGLEILDMTDPIPLQRIFYGAPGTGKSNTIKCDVDKKGLPRVRTTFHPDSDYSTFVGAYKPTSVEVPVMTIIGKEQVPVVNAKPEKKIVYEFVPQAFLKAYTGAWKDQDKPFFLIIEEINRGNCAQIFGDLFQLLDRNDETGLSDYPISPDEDIQKFLLTDKKFGFAALTDEQKTAIPEEVLTGELMILPKNLHIWATMNTSDQSLFPIDSAFKRRWDWQYMPISDGRKGWKIDANGKQYDWWQFLQKMNNQIGSTTNSEDKKLGYYFCKAKGDTIDAETFVGKVIFYVWNDVFKDFAEEAGGLFKDTDGSLLSFNKFYSVGDDGRAKVIEEKVERILSNLGVSPIEVEFNIIDDEAEVENGSGNKHKSLRSVSFPDGIEFTADNMTHFEIYLESLKKIGLDEVCPIIESMKYRRKGCPMMSTEQLPGILNSDFTYHNEGKYFIVKGAIDDTLINILNDLNTKLNLGIDINYE
jgi:hypothetical protein